MRRICIENEEFVMLMSALHQSIHEARSMLRDVNGTTSKDCIEYWENEVRRYEALDNKIYEIVERF